MHSNSSNVQSEKCIKTLILLLSTNANGSVVPSSCGLLVGYVSRQQLMMAQRSKSTLPKVRAERIVLLGQPWTIPSFA